MMTSSIDFDWGKVTVIYDGLCPFCANFVQLQQLREGYEIELCDARLSDAARDFAKAGGYDLDDGMLVLHEGHVYFGEDAVRHLTELQSPTFFRRFLLRPLFKGKRRSVVSYFVLKNLRKAFLILTNRAPISDMRPSFRKVNSDGR